MITISNDDGVTWKTFDDFGVVLQSGKQIEVVTGTRDRTVTIAGKNGVYDFGADLKERAFELPLAFHDAPTERELQRKVRKFGEFLTDSKGRPKNLRIVFDEDTDKFYKVRYAGSMPLERLFAMGFFKLSLVAFDPYAYLKELTTNLGTLDSELALDTDITLDPTDAFVFNGIVTPTTVSVNNFGHIDVSPQIVITGSFTTLTVTANGKTLTYSFALASGTLTLDCEFFKATEGSTNRNNKVSGDWIELLAGYNSVQIGGTGLNCSVSFVFRAKFL